MSGFCLILQRNGSKEREKRRGDRGHPWPVPVEIGKGSDKNPLALCAVGFEYTLEIHQTIFSPNPTYRKTKNINVQLTWSNAFSVSVLRNTEGVLEESAK